MTRCGAWCRPASARCCWNLGAVGLHGQRAGLGAMVNAYTTVKNQGRNVRLVGVTKLSDLARHHLLATVFDSHETEAAAPRASELRTC